MGLLDDAIREHLELKRRHGGDPGEIEAQEREALGAPPPAEPEPEAEPVEPAPDPQTAEHEPSPDAPQDEVEPPAGEEELPSAGHEADAPGYDEDPWVAEDEAKPAEAPPTDEDVLEETPEFLQETPEHDRLWFEQKPPRDFDWDR